MPIKDLLILDTMTLINKLMFYILKKIATKCLFL